MALLRPSARAQSRIRRILAVVALALIVLVGWITWASRYPVPGKTSASAIFLDATVASEDPGFFGHHGIDLPAFWQSRHHRTLTQKLARLLRSGRAPVRETFTAVGLEARNDKDALRSWYVQIAPYGMGRRGVEDAAQYYFHHDAASLSVPESAVLVGLAERLPQRWLDEDTLRAARRDGLARLHGYDPATYSDAVVTAAGRVPIDALVPAYLTPEERGAVDRLQSDPVELFGFGRPEEPTGIRLVAPLLARQVSDYLDEAYFLFDLRGIDHLGVYADRFVRGSSTSVSAHAYGQALDLAGFRFADGTRIRVEDHDDPAVLARLLPLEALLRSYFDVVITWREDPKLHGNHYHCEVVGERPLP